jgi:protein-tyrosine-phosphatase
VRSVVSNDSVDRHNIPIQGQPKQTVSETVTQWAEHLVTMARQKAAKKLGVDKTATGPVDQHAEQDNTKEGRSLKRLDDIVEEEKREDEKERDQQQQYRHAPPGFEDVVRHLEACKVKNPIGSAWLMYNADVHRHNRATTGLHRFGIDGLAFHRNFKTLTAAANRMIGNIDRNTLARLYTDASDSLVEYHQPRVAKLWHYVLDRTLVQAAFACSRNDGVIGRHSEPGVMQSSYPWLEEAHEANSLGDDQAKEEVAGEGKGIPKRKDP